MRTINTATSAAMLATCFASSQALAIGKPFVQDNAARTPAILAQIVLDGRGFTRPVTASRYLDVYRSLGYTEEARTPQSFANWMQSGDIQTVPCSESRIANHAMYVHLVAPNGKATTANLEHCTQGELFGFSQKYQAIVVKLRCGNPVGYSRAPFARERQTQRTLQSITYPGYVIPLYQRYSLGLARGGSIGYGTTRIIQSGGGTSWILMLE